MKLFVLFEGEKGNKKNLMHSIIALSFCALVLTVAVFAWFTLNKQLGSDGLQLELADTATLIVSKSMNEAGDDIGPDISANPSTPDDRFAVSILGENAVDIQPGSSGSFNVYLKSSTALNLNMTHTVMAGTFDEDGNIIEKFKPPFDDEEYTAQQETAVNYLQGHVLLFWEVDDGDDTNDPDSSYVNWMNPFDDADKAIVHLDADAVKKVRFYWIWIASYYQMSDSANSPFSTDVLKKIHDAYVDGETGTFRDRAFVNLLDTRETESSDVTPETALAWLSHYYDFGDENIGRRINNIYFHLKFN